MPYRQVIRAKKLGGRLVGQSRKLDGLPAVVVKGLLSRRNR